MLIRRLKGRPPVSDMLGVGGPGWLAEPELPDDEHATISGYLRRIDVLDGEVRDP